MTKFQVAYVPVGVPTFHLESAQKEFEKSIDLLNTITDAAIVPDKMLLSIQDLTNFLDTIEPSLIILQNITFANAAYASEVLKRFSCPVLLWTLREPVIDGGRLRLNSLTGAYSAGNALAAFRDGNFEYIFGAPQEERTKKTISACIRAAWLKNELKNLRIASVGHTPQGFGFGRAMDADMQKVFGATLESIEVRELIDMAKGYTDDECSEYLDKMTKCTVGLDKTPDNNRKDFARLCKAYKEYVDENNIGALSSRCWPDFFTAFGTPVCGVLAMLNDMGVAASCEADTYGALSMYMGMKLSEQAVFFDQRGGQRFFDIRCGGKCSTHTLGQVRAAHALCLRIHRHQWRGRGALYRQHYGIHHLPCRECAAHFAEEQIFAPDFQLLKRIRIVEIGQN